MAQNQEHERLLEELHAQCAGAPVYSLDCQTKGWEESLSILTAAMNSWLFVRALGRTNFVRASVTFLIGAYAIFTATPLRCLGLDDTWEFTLIRIVGIYMWLRVARGIPGVVPFLEVTTKPGFYVQEARCPRNERIRKRMDSWLQNVFFTPYLRSGEWSTLLAFLWKPKRNLKYERIWTEVSDGERVAADWVFPPSGYNPEKPVVLILPGLAPAKHWTETSEFVADAAFHLTTKLDTTVVVFVPRGTMQTKILKNDFDAGASVTDVREVVTLMHKVLTTSGSVPHSPQIFGVGFSLGAGMLSNYCGVFGGDERLAGAVCFSGMLDGNHMLNFEYSLRTWQVALSIRMKKTLFTGPAVERAQSRGVDVKHVTSKHVRSIVDLYEQYAVPYHGYKDMEDLNAKSTLAGEDKWRKVSIPLLNIAARDDPITHCDSLRAEEFSAGNKNLLFLITNRGGHTAFPVGMMPWRHGYAFMNEAIEVFIDSVMGRGVSQPAITDCSATPRWSRISSAMNRPMRSVLPRMSRPMRSRLDS